MADDNGQSKPTAAAAKAEQPTTPKKAKKKGRKKTAKRAAGSGRARGGAGRVKFPKHSILGCIRIPQAILEQNAGEACTDKEGAAFAKIGWTGDMAVEISSASKYGLLERPTPGKIKPTDFVRKITRPQDPN